MRIAWLRPSRELWLLRVSGSSLLPRVPRCKLWFSGYLFSLFFSFVGLAGFWVLQSAGSVWAGWRCGICSRALPTGRVLRPKAAQLLLVFVCVCVVCGVCCVCVWCVVCVCVCVVFCLVVLYLIEKKHLSLWLLLPQHPLSPDKGGTHSPPHRKRRRNKAN